MSQPGTQAAPLVPPVLDPLFELSDDSEQIAHLVCCRDVSWRRAFCGEEGDHLMTSFRVVCTLCIEVADQMNPGWRSQDHPSCPVDDRPCPPESEMDAEYDRRSV